MVKEMSVSPKETKSAAIVGICKHAKACGGR